MPMRTVTGLGTNTRRASYAPRAPCITPQATRPMRVFDNNTKNPDAYYETKACVFQWPIKRNGASRAAAYPCTATLTATSQRERDDRL